MRKRKQVHHGDPVYEDDDGRLFVKSGNANVYLKSATLRKIKGRRKKEPEQIEESPPKQSFVFHRKT